MKQIAQIQSIGLFGGSFDPPHLAHVLAVAWALAGGEVGRVWVIPSGGHPFGKKMAPYADRREMCRRAIACFGRRVRLDNVERGNRVHYTIDTVRELSRRHPGQSWRWIMGSDTLEESQQWRAFAQVMRLAPPLIIPRRGHVPRGGSHRRDFTLPDLSSTFLRRRLAARRLEGLECLLPGSVLDYILQKNLY